MIEIAQYIESLLLENDCVIVPGLGGFVAHYNPAMRVTEENLFLPPTRTIGFNPQLKMNDGLLVQSYMAAYDTNFTEATRRLEREVESLSQTLHDEGKVELPNVGELRCSIHGTYDFTPYDNLLTTPALYGLDCFEMLEVASQTQSDKREQGDKVARRQGNKKLVSLPRRLLTASTQVAAAMIAVIVLFFFLSTPIENTEVAEGSHAQLMPSELFGRIEKQSLLTHPVAVVTQGAQKRKKPVKPVAVKEVKVKEVEKAAEAKPEPAPAQPKQQLATATTAALPYHIIVASVGTEQDAEAMAKRLVEKGHPNARAIIGDGKMRVCIDSFATETEAYRALGTIRETVTEQAWVLKK